MDQYDAVVVGAGPNGLAAGIVLAQAGLSVLLVEGKSNIGGGCRTEELTLPGFRHDVCAAIHPMGALSPVFRVLALEKYGLEWVPTPVPLVHVMDGRAVSLHCSLDETAAALREDGDVWKNLMKPFLADARGFFNGILRPIRVPDSPLLMARFGITAMRSCEAVLRSRFKTAEAKALFAGCAAHAVLPLDRAGTASFGLVLALAGHAVGWPCARRGSGEIIAAMERCFRAHGGEIRTGQMIRSLHELPPSKAVLFDLSPQQVTTIARDELPTRYLKALERFRYGPGIFKVDWALDGPIPWKQHACSQAATVHVGGTAQEVLQSEHEMGNGRVPDRPFVLLAQQSLFDPTRAPAGKQTGWAYCHVPNGCTVDMTDRIEAQIERFAPGFRDRILARHVRSPREYQQYNPNMIGGDLGGGANDLWQFMFRPVMRYNPYSTPNKRLFLCSSSTPPGGGVHGMCGYWAADTVLRKLFGRSAPEV